ADFETARTLFEQAVARDPTYAAAYAGLADTFVLLALHRRLAPSEAFPRAKAAAERAIEIAPNLADAHASLAACSFYFDRDGLNAERHFRRAIELKPAYATARQWYANYLTARGRTDQALEQIRAAQRLDPLSPMMHAVGGWLLFLARRYGDA